MITSKIAKYNFSLDLYEKNRIHQFYKTVHNPRTKQDVVNPLSGNINESSLITEIKCIPEFLTPVPISSRKTFQILKIHRIKGYCIDLTGYTSVAEYLNANLGSRRKNFKRQLKRLESCYDITHKVYFGNIDKVHFDELFDKMSLFLKKRFEQKGETFDPSINLNELRTNCYPMVLEKKASLHVIYNGDEPIDICLNYHYQDILVSSISSYDIDYAKFGLGNLDIVKQLEWAIENNYRIYDLMWGDLPYKQYWCNRIYQYEHHLFYNPKSVAQLALGKTLVTFYKLKDYLDGNNINIRKKTNGKTSPGKTNHHKKVSIKKVDIKEIEITNLLYEEINTDLESNQWLKLHVNNFQYQYMEHTKFVSVYRSKKNPKTYIVFGRTIAVELVIQGD